MLEFFFLLFFPLSAIPEKKIREDKPGKGKKKGGGEGEKKGYSEYQRGG